MSERDTLLLVAVSVFVLRFRQLPLSVMLTGSFPVAVCLLSWTDPDFSGDRFGWTVAAAIALILLWAATRISVAPGQTRLLQSALANSRWVRSGRLTIQKILGSLILHVDLPQVGRGRWLFWARQRSAHLELDMRFSVSSAALDGARRVRLYVCREKDPLPAWLIGARALTPKGSKLRWICWPPGVRAARRLVNDDRLRAAIEGLQDVSLQSKRGRLAIKTLMYSPIEDAIAAAGWPDRTLDLIETLVTRWAEVTREGSHVPGTR
jgi:hypothetical protein